MWTAIFLAALISLLQPLSVHGYFERGPVQVFVGKQEVALEPGQSEAVSVSFSPNESSQLPGCGMAECPQICGEKNCLDENGECICNGTDYQTYKAFATVTSSAPGVAAAEYIDGGILQITGVSSGTAVITVTASLRQFTSTSTEVYVTVTEPAVSEAPPEQDIAPVKEGAAEEQAGGGKGASSESDGSGLDVQPVDPGNHEVEGILQEEIEAESVTGHSEDEAAIHTSLEETSAVSAVSTEEKAAATAAPQKKKRTKKEENKEEDKKEKNDAAQKRDVQKKVRGTGEKGGANVIKSDRGDILMVPIEPGKMGKEEMKSVLGKEMYVDFQMKDEAETILYTWEFYGMDLERAEDMDMAIDVGASPLEGCAYGTAADSLYLSFAHDGQLPGKASAYIRVAESFADGESLNYYCYNPEEGIELMAEGLPVENGYVALPMEHCSDYILTTEKWEEDEGKSGHYGYLAAAAAVIAGAAAVAFAVGYKKRRGRK